MIQYCTRCVMPATKPDLELDAEGVCSACRAYERRAVVDWGARERELAELFGRYRGDGSWYDCVIPVSGGKDSTFQVMTALRYGMTPLCVTGTTCDLSDIGRANISNLQRLGVDYVEFTSNRAVRAKMNRIALDQVGDISLPEHMSIFVIPVRLAVQYRIPLIVWGENSQNEYGGPAASQDNSTLTRDWLFRFGGLLGMTPDDFVGRLGIEARHMLPFVYPTDEALANVGVTGLFLGHYIPWDGMTNALFSQAHGLTTFPRAVEGSLVSYENLDNHQTGIHDYFCYLKYGFGRVTAQACLQIRRGRLSRGDAIDIVWGRDGAYPWTCLGKPLEDTLAPLGMSIDEFNGICDKWTNADLFTKVNGVMIRRRDGSPLKLNHDNQ